MPFFFDIKEDHPDNNRQCGICTDVCPTHDSWRWRPEDIVCEGCWMDIKRVVATNQCRFSLQHRRLRKK